MYCPAVTPCSLLRPPPPPIFGRNYCIVLFYLAPHIMGSSIEPVSWENGDPQNRGLPSPFYREYGDGDPDFPSKMGTRVHILPGIWGPSLTKIPFSWKMGMGIPILPRKWGSLGTQLYNYHYNKVTLTTF